MTFELSKELHGFQYEVEAQTDIDKIQEKQEEKFYHAVWDIMDYARNEREVDKKTLVSYLKRHLAHAIRFDYEDN